MSYNQKFLLLPKGRYTPRTPRLFLSRNEALTAIRELPNKTVTGTLHYDLETTSLSFHDENLLVTTIGMACEEFCIGINLVELTLAEQAPLWAWLRTKTLGGFNLAFDAAWPFGEDLRDVKLGMDTAVIFRALATDAGKGVRLNLEALIDECLGWENHQKDWLKKALEKHGLPKDEMWKLSVLEPQGYTYYCAMDSEASFQAEDYFTPILQEFDLLKWNKIWCEKIKRVIRAQYKGITIDREAVIRNKTWVNARMLRLENEIANHPDVKPILDDWRERALAKTYQLKIEEKRIRASKADTPWLAPDVWSLETNLTAEQREKLPSWLQEYQGYFYRVEPRFDLKGKNNGYPRFNFRSTEEMSKLIYEGLLAGQYEITYTHREGERPKGYVTFERNGRQYEVDLTHPGGSKPSGGDVLKPFGEVGALIDEYKELQKLSEEFLDKFLLASARTGRIHCGLMVHGTNTGRCSGGSSKKADKTGKKKKKKQKLDGSQWSKALENGDDASENVELIFEV